MKNFIVNSHIRYHTKFTHGKGMYLFQGKEKYLDFMAGIAVNSMGHSNQKIVDTLITQSQKLWHVSNLFYTDIMQECAETICKASGMENVFFSNSGSEAVETAIKVARKYFHDKNINRSTIITMKGSFHGRSITNISASNEEAYTKGFAPLLQGFSQVQYGDITALKNSITQETAGILLEVIQGEGGLNFAGWDYIKQVAQIAKENGILLLLDEVQCGAGRTGKFNAFQYTDIQPDIIAMAKGIGAGFPVGATLFAKSTANVITVGSHGTTFGGNPLAMAVVNEVCKELSDTITLERIRKAANFLNEKLQKLQEKFPNIIKEIRGIGLMTGFSIQEKYTAKFITDALFANKLIVVPARNNTIRLLPPLIVEKKHIDEAIKIMESVFTNL